MLQQPPLPGCCVSCSCPWTQQCDEPTRPLQLRAPACASPHPPTVFNQLWEGVSPSPAPRRLRSSQLYPDGDSPLVILSGPQRHRGLPWQGLASPLTPGSVLTPMGSSGSIQRLCLGLLGMVPGQGLKAPFSFRLFAAPGGVWTRLGGFTDDFLPSEAAVPSQC